MRTHEEMLKIFNGVINHTSQYTFDGVSIDIVPSKDLNLLLRDYGDLWRLAIWSRDAIQEEISLIEGRAPISGRLREAYEQLCKALGKDNTIYPLKCRACGQEISKLHQDDQVYCARCGQEVKR